MFCVYFLATMHNSFIIIIGFVKKKNFKGKNKTTLFSSSLYMKYLTLDVEQPTINYSTPTQHESHPALLFKPFLLLLYYYSTWLYSNSICILLSQFTRLPLYSYLTVALQLCILGLTCYFIYQQNSSLGGNTLFHSNHTEGFRANIQSNLH